MLELSEWQVVDSLVNGHTILLPNLHDYHEVYSEKDVKLQIITKYLRLSYTKVCMMPDVGGITMHFLWVQIISI